MENNKLETISKLFEDKEIRSVWDSEKEEYYFSVVDVIGVLTESTDSNDYWYRLKKKNEKRGKKRVVDKMSTTEIKIKRWKIL